MAGSKIAPNSGAGMPAGMSPIVFTSSPSAIAATVPASSATSTDGIFFVTFGKA